MEPLFETKTTLTLDECIKMQKQILKRGKFLRIPCAILSVLMVLYSLYFSMYLYTLIFVAMAWLWTFGDSFFNKMNAKKIFDSNKSIQNLELTYNFYEDYLIQESEIGRTEIKYADLKKISESKTHFYLINKGSTAVIVIKENCDEALCEFIRKLKVK